MHPSVSACDTVPATYPNTPPGFACGAEPLHELTGSLGSATRIRCSILSQLYRAVLLALWSKSEAKHIGVEPRLPRPQVRLDVHLELRRPERSLDVAPHGLIGQSFDGSDVGVGTGRLTRSRSLAST